MAHSSPSDFSASNSVEHNLSEHEPKYTTVGSVYKPNANVPLQPPARRGRVLRWSNTAPGPDFGAFNKTYLSGLPTGQLPRSPPTTASSFQQYSPLQQNYDRAATPIMDPQRGVLQYLDIPVPTPSPADMQFSPDSPLPPFAMDRNEHINMDDEEDLMREETLANARLNVKAIQSLASYPNPNRRAAQKTLARARPALAAATNVPRAPMTPSFGESISDLSSERTMRAPALPNAMSISRNGPEFKYHADERLAQAAVRHLERREHIKQLMRAPKPSGLNDLAYKNSGFTTLATGPGAPQPLTAGPPGQRQYKPSTFEATVKAFQESAQKVDHIAEHPVGQHHGPLPVSHGRPGDALLLHPQPISPSRPSVLLPRTQTEIDRLTIGPPRLRSARAPVVTSSTQVRDTLPAEALRQYYPHGFPSDIGRLQKTVQYRLNPNYKLNLHAGYEKPAEQLAMQNAKLNAAFYGGMEAMGKTADDFIRDAERRHLDKTIGSREEERRNRRVQLATALNIADRIRPEIPRLSIEEAMRQPTAQHSGVLLNLTFAALLSYVEDEGSKGRPSGFDVPDPWLIDKSLAGRKSFWGYRPGEVRRRNRREYRG